jgi:hypothetical protein
MPPPAGRSWWRPHCSCGPPPPASHPQQAAQVPSAADAAPACAGGRTWGSSTTVSPLAVDEVLRHLALLHLRRGHWAAGERGGRGSEQRGSREQGHGEGAGVRDRDMAGFFFRPGPAWIPAGSWLRKGRCESGITALAGFVTAACHKPRGTVAPDSRNGRGRFGQGDAGHTHPCHKAPSRCVIGV